MAENTTGGQLGSRRAAQIERMRKKNPERNYEDDESLFGAISDDYDAYEDELAGYKENEKTLSDMLATDPRSAQFLTDMHRGKDPVVGLVRNFGIEIKDCLDDPAMQEEIAEANREYVERVAQNKALEDEYNANLEETKQTLAAYQEERGLSDDDIDAIFAKALSIASDGVMGKFTRETLDMISKAMNYESDVAMASEEGEIAGRNAQITERLRKGKQGDGIGSLSGKPGRGVGKEAPKTMFDWANEAV